MKALQKAFGTAILAVSACFCSKVIMIDREKKGFHASMSQIIDVYTFQKGFSSQTLDGEMIQRIWGKSYRPGAPVTLEELRYLRICHVDFEGNTREGEMIVHEKIAHNTLKIFYHLYEMKYPVEKMKLIDEYGGDDEKSMADNNTSAFNYRNIANTNQMSNHSRGLAIDINPRINPYITPHGIAPANSGDYVERDAAKCRGRYRDFMIHRGDEIYTLFRKYGFSWGGEWEHAKDYQHFEAVQTESGWRQ